MRVIMRDFFSSRGRLISASTSERTPSPPNLFVNGIGLFPGPDGAEKYDEFARNQDAKWVRVYNTGSLAKDVWHVVRATPRPFTGRPRPTAFNGLKDPDITDCHYDTVYAYSGGTRTVVTAIRKYNLRCRKLVLISPMRVVPAATFKKELEELLKNEASEGYGVKEIEIHQSSKDELPFGRAYQAYFDTDDPWLKGKNIKIKEVPLPFPSWPWTGREAHRILFKEVSKLLMRSQ